MDEAVYSAIEKTIKHNPASKFLTIAILNAAIEESPYDSVVEAAESVPVPKTCTTTPHDVVRTMVSQGALERNIYVDGERYEGTLEELQADDSIGEDADIEYTLKTTEEGTQIAQDYSPESSIERLFIEKSQHAHGLMVVLSACAEEGGKSRDEIAALFELEENRPDLRINERTNMPTVYPTVFTTELELAGAVAWSGTWKTTESGRNFLSRRSK